MLVCLDLRSGTGCGAANPDASVQCQHCGRPLRYSLQLHDPGDRVDHYHILGILGIGGFGAVYKAEDLQHPGVEVALKETLDPTNIRAFQGEFAVLHRLRHSNLPRYHSIFESDGNGYLVMDFVPGQSLDDILKRQADPLNERQVLGYALQLCDALGYLHRQQPPILHRDIKPANIRLTHEGLIKLVDFGLLKEGDGLTRSSRRGLTPAYAPLEQYGGTGQHTDQRSDIYSLGATLYHLLTGVEPIPVTDRIAVSVDPLVPPRQINPALSPPVSAAVMKAMSLRPADRYADVETMEQAWMVRAPAMTTVPMSQQPPAILPSVLLPHRGSSSALSSMMQNRILRYIIGIVVALMVIVFTGKFFSNSPKQGNSMAAGAGSNPILPTSTPVSLTPIIQTPPLVAQAPLAPPTATSTPLPTATSTPPPTATPNPTATPLSTPTPNPKVGDVLYQADWSQGLSGWSGGSDWKTVGNMLVNDGTGRGLLGLLTAPYNAGNITDYAVEAEMQTVSRVYCGSRLGILIRSTNQVGYTPVIGGCDESTILIFSHTTTSLDKVATQSGGYSPDTSWHVYRVEAKGNVIRFFIDGRLQIEATDNLYLSGGQVGLSDAGIVLNIRSFKVIKL